MLRVIPKLREFEEQEYPDDFYTKDIINNELEDDEITTHEEAFMNGYLNAY